MHVEVMEAKLWHCGEMARKLRTEHSDALRTIGVSCHHELRRQFDASVFRKAMFINGRLVALGGVNGMKISVWGFVWFVLTEDARQHPIAVTKMVIQQIKEVMGIYREISTTIIPTDESAKRLAIFLGFHVSDDGEGRPAKDRASRRRLAKFIDETSDYRITVGSGTSIVMGYHLGGT